VKKVEDAKTMKDRLLCRLCGLSKTFYCDSGEVRAVHDFSLDIPSAGFIVVAGTSGCGKTTLLKLVAGLEKADKGEMVFPGDTRQRNEPASPRPRFGFVFQDARLLPWLRLEENLRLAFPVPEKPETREEIEKVLALVGLAGWKAAYPRQLSGGMAQRAALARALCRKPQVLLLDEPFGALDAFTRMKLRRELDGLWKTLEMTVIMVTHDIEEAVYLADRIVLMKAGGIQGKYEVRLSRPRERHSPEFQALCGEIEKGIENDG
jgi:sulfonate transport system ATP-binding protein